MKTQEKKLRKSMASLSERIEKLMDESASGKIGPLTFRARVRFAKQELAVLEEIAKELGHEIPC